MSISTVPIFKGLDGSRGSKTAMCNTKQRATYTEGSGGESKNRGRFGIPLCILMDVVVVQTTSRSANRRSTYIFSAHQRSIVYVKGIGGVNVIENVMHMFLNLLR